MPTFAASDGAVLHYDDLGSSTDHDPTCALVALAGGAARRPEYLGDLAGLAGARRVLVPHLRGVGSSSAAVEPAAGSWWDQAQDLEDLRRHLGVARLVLLAHSAGTRQAVAYAARFPAHVDRLVLLTPPAGYLVDVPSDAPSIIARRADDDVFAAAAALLAAGPDVVDDDTFTAWQQAAAPATYATWGERERAHAARGRWHLQAARAYLAAEPPDDLAQQLRGVTAPVLVVAGAEDALTGVAPLRALADLFPAGRCVVLEDCGHYPWVEQPAAFRTAVDDFLDDAGASSTAGRG